MADEPKANAGERRSLRVLVVEDNRDGADSLCRLLRAWGSEPLVAYDGPSGLETARAHTPDCLVLDIGLPLLDGFELARRVREQPGLEGAQLVALTGFSGEEYHRRAREAGFDLYLTKPAEPSELKEILERMDEVVRLAGRTEELARQNVARAPRLGRLTAPQPGRPAAPPPRARARRSPRRARRCRRRAARRRS